MASKSRRQPLDLPLFDPGRVQPPRDDPPQSSPARRGVASREAPVSREPSQGEPASSQPRPSSPTEAPASANGTAERPLTVTQLAGGVRDVLDTCFADVWVVGQISGLKRATSGHLYFDLKDDQSQLSCVMWRDQASRVREPLENGTEAVVRGRVSFYPAGGRCQVYVTQLRPVGLGALEVRFRQLKERLEKEGLFASDRKQPLPTSPQTVAVVTSPTGAAIRDIIHVLSRRWPGLRILLYAVRVQGEGAAEEIARAVGEVDRLLYGEADVVIVGRGGGSMEDLWAFNEESVARAVASCRIPVVSAVGHETDFTICDFVADVRAPTPSAAAEIVVPDHREWLARLGVQSRRLARAAEVALASARHRVDRVAEHRFFRYPEEIAGLPSSRVDELAGRLAAASTAGLELRRRRLHELERRLSPLRPTERLASMRARLAAASVRHEAAGRRAGERARATVERLGARLEALSPLAVLQRGYSITLAEATGKAVRAAEDVAAGEVLSTLVARGGRIRSRVTE
ncbi:MAG TPA: exodeoxyribonuclease VII large subunit [Phycisphaerae bacterium]|nr:exodeoxyribonuclease VII large subunit [Phycisphaerae bacterium]